MKHFIKEKNLWCVHRSEEAGDFYLQQKEKIYDENNNCVECMEYFYDPHLPTCSHSDDTDQHSACGACGEWNNGEHNCSEEVVNA